MWNHYIGNLKAFEDTYFEILKFGIENSPAMSFADIVFSSTAGYVSSALKLYGPQTTFWNQFSPFSSIFYVKNSPAENNIFVIGASDESSQYEQKMMQEKSNQDKKNS